MFKVVSKVNFKNTEKLLKRKDSDPMTTLKRYAQSGVDALSAATPVDTGLTASSWYYEIEKTRNGYIISWNNSNVENGVPVALLIQLGHATKSGTYVQGIDYINPALKDIFKQFSIDIGKEFGN